MKKIIVFIVLICSQLLNAYYKIPFSHHEKEFLKKHPIIRIAPDPHFQPVEYIDEKGNYKGMSADFMKIISKELGVKFQIVRCKDWNEVLRKAQKREIDLLPAAAQTPERAAYMDFSTAYLTFPGMIITLKTNKTIHNIEDLYNKKVALGEGYVWEEFISKDHPEIQLVPVKNLQTGFIKLTNQEVDAVIASLPIALHIIKTNGYSNLKIAGESGYHTKLSTLTRNDWPQLSFIIDKALQNIPNGEKQKILDKWLGKSIDGYEILIKIIIAIVIVLILTIFSIMLWNKSLKLKVKEKTNELNNKIIKLTEKEKENFELTQIQNKIIQNTKFWISIFDKDLNLVFWNKAAELITGYKKEDVLTTPHKDLIFKHENEDIPAREILKEIFENNINYDDVESTIYTKNQQLIEMAFFTRIMKNQEGNPSGLLVIGRDITKEKQSEKNRTESIRFLNFLNKLSSNLSHSFSLYEVAQNSVHLIREYLDNSFVIIMLADEKKDILKSYYWEGNKPGTWKNGASFPIKGSITGRSFLTKNVEYVTDLLKDTRVDYRITNALYNQGFKTIIIVPLTFNDESFGTINIVSQKENYGINEKDKLMAIGKTIGLSIQNSIYIERINKQIEQIGKAKEELTKNIKEYKNLLYYNPYGIIIHKNGIVKYCNHAFLKILEIENQEEILNQNVMPFVHPDSKELVKERIKSNSKATEFIPPVIEKIISKKGKTRWVESSAFSLENGDKLVMLKDITQRKLAEKEKEELQKHLIQNDKMEAIALLAGGIAHDFNNFLTIITGSIDILTLITKDQEKAQNILYTASKATENAKNLTQQLLTFSKGGEPIKKTSSLIDIVKDTTNFVLSGTKIKPQFEIDKNLWLCQIDEGQISQVIQNIILNARQVMGGGGIIKISMKNVDRNNQNKYHLEDNNYVEISIKDEGPGISQENLGKIFTPYFTTKKEGSGIGLAVCYSIIKKHNGYIFAESKEYFGTTFKIYLPSVDQSNKIILKNISKTTEEFSGKILLMDDEDMILKIGKEMLELLGFEVETTKSGEEAITAYTQAFNNNKPFDLTIVDLTVPGNKGGKETLEELLSINQNAKVIVSSGYSNSAIMAHYKNYGFVASIIKPYTLDKLINVIKGVLKNNVSGV
jgi:PAS domain S-box-containing protein